MSNSGSNGSPIYLRILLKFAGNCALTWAMSNYLSQYFVLTGGLSAYITIGALLTLMNMIVRPILAIVTLPLKLFATILALIIVNGAFVQLADLIVQKMDPTVVTLTIAGGLVGWSVIAIVLGLGNWFMKEILK